MFGQFSTQRGKRASQCNRAKSFNRSMRMERCEDRLMLHGFDHDGQWEGVTETGGTVRFNVASHFITFVSVMSPGDGDDCSVSNSFSPIVSIGNNHHFFIEQGGTTSYHFEGTLFDEWAEGTLELFRSNRLCHTERWTARVPFLAPATIRVTRSSSLVDENADRINLDAEADFPWALPRTVDLAFSGSATKGVDYTLSPSEDILIEPFELTGRSRLTATSDSVDEPNETVSISVLGVSNGEIATPATLSTVTIMDDDQPPVPEIAISPTSHNFGAIALNSGSATVTFTINNSGMASLNLTSSPPVRISGANAADFTVTQQPASSVAPGGQVSFGVVFNPVAAGTRQASLVIANNDSNENPLEISLTGIGVPTPGGDFNGNRTIDAADYVVWRKMLGQTGIPAFSGADADGDGTVTPSDYTVWRANFGASVPPPSSGNSATSAVTRTEPASGMAPLLPVRSDANMQTLSARNFSSRPAVGDLSFVAASYDDALVAWLASKGKGRQQESSSPSFIDMASEPASRDLRGSLDKALQLAFASLCG
jgi:hypothetical protein